LTFAVLLDQEIIKPCVVPYGAGNIVRIGGKAKVPENTHIPEFLLSPWQRAILGAEELSHYPVTALYVLIDIDLVGCIHAVYTVEGKTSAISSPVAEVAVKQALIEGVALRKDTQIFNTHSIAPYSIAILAFS
jgi:hypothetical protein